MTHWKLTLSYDGTGFHGWQIQPGLPTIQGTLSQALAHVTGEQVLPQGSGRTDAGVHALAQVISFALEVDIPPNNLQHALNRALPPAIRILAAQHVSTDFHARYSALAKTYEFRIFARRSQPSASNDAERICPPFLAPYAWDCRWPIDLHRMEAAAAHFVGEHDFAAFAASDPDRTTREQQTETVSNTVRTIASSVWTRDSDLLLYRVTGSGFLHHMVRNLVGTMVDAGRGAITPARVQEILLARDRTLAGPTAPPQGLFLVSVDYPEVPA